MPKSRKRKLSKGKIQEREEIKRNSISFEQKIISKRKRTNRKSKGGK
jgi:hypothetical protein